ncbi:sigZ [Symbiodinium microadriaticum]|nr:sigZ [Symbiodinium microadriaticum]
METATIWANFKQELLGFIKSKVNDSNHADDILQDVFVKIHLNLGQLKSEERLTSWIYQITRNSIIDFYRKNQNMLELEDVPIEEDTSSLNDSFAQCVRPFMEELSDSDRQILTETVFGGISQKDYAKNHNLSHSGAKSRTQRARHKLKKVFTDCCLIESDRYGNITNVVKKGCHCKAENLLNN